MRLLHVPCPTSIMNQTGSCKVNVVQFPIQLGSSLESNPIFAVWMHITELFAATRSCQVRRSRGA